MGEPTSVLISSKPGSAKYSFIKLRTQTVVDNPEARVADDRRGPNLHHDLISIILERSTGPTHTFCRWYH